MSYKVLDNAKLDFFINTLFYYLKYRPFDTQALEMHLIAFKAGVVLADERKSFEEYNP